MLLPEGYSIDSSEFLAVNLDANTIVQTLEHLEAENTDAQELSFNVREGYERMLSVTATRPVAETQDLVA